MFIKVDKLNYIDSYILKELVSYIPVDGNVGVCIIKNFDHDGVAPLCIECWPGELPVHR